jgi:glycosyltransferase involved in cell wall biosynthesis
LRPVSVCLTTYNRAETLGSTIESILAQSFADFDLIVSDDCSTDDTASLCAEYARRDTRVIYRRNATNLKMPGNLNAALASTSSPLVANLHDGDTFRPDLLASWKQALDERPSAAFVFNAYELQTANGTVLCTIPLAGVLPRDFVARYYFQTFSSCVWGTVMARRAAYEGVGWFNPRYGFISDVDMWLTLARHYECVHIPQPLIQLSLREATHPFAFHSWDLLFWQFTIYAQQLAAYRSVLGEEDYLRYAAGLQPLMRRRFSRAMLSLIKHRQWDRVRDGFAIWCASPLRTLSVAGCLLRFGHATPSWYDPGMWHDLAIQEDSVRA